MKENLQNQQWLDEIRNEMQDFEAPIPADGWERVSSSLPSQKKPMIGKRWMSIAASVLLCAMIGGGYYFYGNTSDAVIGQTEIAESIPSPEQQVATLPQEEPAPQQHNQQHTLIVKKQAKTDITAVTPEAIIDTAENAEEKIVVAHHEAEERQEQTDTIIPILSREENNVLMAMNEVSNKTHKEAGWTLGIHIGGHGSLLDNEMIVYTGSAIDSPIYDDPTSGDDPMNGDIIDTDAPVEVDGIIDSNHHVSWSFGLSAGRQILPKTTLETGLVYTLLTSDVKMKLSGIKNQRIEYLGIPVKLNYQIVGNHQGHFYVSGGLMLERALSAKRGDEELDVKPWQWSSNLSLGGQLRIYNHLSLYLEPGVIWYFDADTSAPSLRSESPVFFNLRGGFRFSY